MVDFEKKVQIELEGVVDNEELLQKQNSHSNWLLVGDRNAKYFHSQASRRKRVNQFKASRLKDGEWSYDEDQIKIVVMEFYRRLYTDD